jgi:hypothetical protein
VKFIFDYETIKSEPHAIIAANINPYLVDAQDVILTNRNLPISGTPEITYGSFALDDGHFTLTASDKASILEECPQAIKYIRPFIGGQELIRGEERWCLWLKDAAPQDLLSMPPIKRRVTAVKSWRSNSDRATTVALSATPSIFAEIRQPDMDYLAFPTVSSERRPYIPVAFLPKTTIASNQIYVLANPMITQWTAALPLASLDH